ncbi:alpha/beta fold hydrolase [Glaciimonas soli]|uniref:Alpha/beta fold hydrolase n=1 Tax=Glaciimonas soli TaxID=2590999 RepID=A0A843YR56_9BURK|nr:alpha/beta hydrolase [Glaciimonas soli]MQR01590.1 alpha/beta fold hydrolase [Glaciimonas soli]
MASLSQAQGNPKNKPVVYGEQLEGFDYAYPVHIYAFESQAEEMHMAYIDSPPSNASKPNGHTAVLLHGKNFCAGTWETTIKALNDDGYRVIAPDQIGFCKSTKPERYQYSLHQLANNTRALLDSLGIGKSIVVGHSMGGMLAIRYALMYPDAVERLALVDPIGLEDWKAQGVPYSTIDQLYARELKTSADSIKNYQRNTYYADEWKPEFDRWVQMLAGMYRGPGLQAVARNSALTYDMIYTQPVFYEFEQLKMPTALFIGWKDNTAIGKDTAPPEVRARLGNYKELGKAAAARIPHAQLIEFEDLGHAPQIQAPERFNKALLKALDEN